jgi:hypothetical protein
VSLDARRSGDAIAESSGDLARLWRSAIAHSRPQVWPGLLDGIAEDMFLRAGESLAAGRDPALLWPEILGVIRLDARDADRSRAELESEWDVFASVLASACDALSSGDEVREWLARAVAAARAGARTLEQDRGRRGLLVVWWLPAIPPARRPSAPAPGPR